MRREVTSPIAAIVLAAGASHRMGTNKMLLELDGEPLVRRACRRALAAGLAPVIVVLGHEVERVQNALSGLSCRVTVNKEYARPMSGSLHAGIECLPAASHAAVVMLADMVNVTAQMLRKLRIAARANGAPLIASRYATTLAPPILFRKALFGELLATKGEGAGKAVVEKYQAEALFIDWPAAALIDVDTPQDFARLSR